MGEVSDRLWHKAGKKRVPLTGAFELLPVCNLHCKMCYVRKSMEEVRQQGGLLSGKEWLEYARQAREEGLLYPLLTGGEPFLHADFQEIHSGMLDMGLQVSINSNGTMIDESMAKWLGQHRPVRINLTLYGAGEEAYQNLCGDGDAYNRMRRAVEWLKQYGVPVKFNTSITSENVNDLEEIINYAKSVDSPIQVATYMFPPVRRDAQMIGYNNRLSPEEAALARVKADWLQGDPRWFLGQTERFRQFIPVTGEMLKKQSTRPGLEMRCRAGRCSFWIDWQGNIGNCGMYTSAKFSLKENSFAEGWKQVVDATEKIRYAPMCTNCPNFRICHVCIAMVYNESGNQDGYPEYLCKMNEAAARYYQEFVKKLSEEIRKQEPEILTDSHECDIEELQ